MLYKIEEIAKICNVTRQAIYNKLRKDIDENYITEVNGFKRITEDGLTYFKSIYNVDEGDGESTTTELTKDFTEYLDEIKELYKELLEQKDKQIKDLTNMIEILRQENIELTDIVKENNKLRLNEQVTQQKILNNTEVMLLEKQRELEERKKKFNEESIYENKNWFQKLFTVKN